MSSNFPPSIFSLLFQSSFGSVLREKKAAPQNNKDLIFFETEKNVVSNQQCPQKELSAKDSRRNNIVSQNLSVWNERSEFKDQQDQKFTYKDQRRSKIKDQLVPRINRSKFIRDQGSTRSKIKKINRRSTSFRSRIKSSKFNFSQIRSLIWS